MLNTENKNNYIFKSENLVVNILGGLSDLNLGSLRVTLKITKEGSTFSRRDSVDLYNGSQVEKLMRKIAEELEVGIIAVRRMISQLIDTLEVYRFDNIEQENEENAIEYELDESEYNEAKELLESKDLLITTNKLIGASGIVGEENNRLLMYLIFTSRKTANPLHCISFGNSGVGKTHLQSKVAELIPNEDKVEFTMLSPNAFFYFNQYELRNKLLVIEDMDGAKEGLLPLRELQTKKRITKSIVNKTIGGVGKTTNRVVEGPVCVAGCTTQESIYEDNSNRSFLLYIDESSAQDERIMAYQRMHYAGKVDIDQQLRCAKLLRNAQRILEPIKVINPYAEYLELPKSVFKPRRTNIHYLQLIEVITFYHQFQRERLTDEQTGEDYIETSLNDIQLANTLIKEVLLRKSDNLNTATRNHLEELIEYLKNHQKKTFSNQEIRRAFRLKEPTHRRYRNSLSEEGFIQKRTDIKGVSTSYELVYTDEFKDLETSIEKALELCIEKLVSSSEVRHS
ncbi:hypothetical protein OAT18_02985 [Tenacibaculum sp.]|nr:hypothetical protein [Tenacibaculum sp.]